MKRFDSTIFTVTAAFLLFLGTTGTTALADTYSWQAVRYTQSEMFTAGDDFGNYTINISSENRFQMGTGSDCGGVISHVCYLTQNVSSTTPLYTTTPPPLMVDPDPIAGDVDCSLYAGNRSYLCNNGHALYFGFLTKPDGTEIRGMFAGADPDPLTDYIGSATFDGGFMTANGTAYFIDGFHDTLDVVRNLSTTPVPEPESLVLLGTGAVALLGMARRRFGL